MPFVIWQQAFQQRAAKFEFEPKLPVAAPRMNGRYLDSLRPPVLTTSVAETKEWQGNGVRGLIYLNRSREGRLSGKHCLSTQLLNSIPSFASDIDQLLSRNLVESEPLSASMNVETPLRNDAIRRSSVGRTTLPADSIT